MDAGHSDRDTYRPAIWHTIGHAHRDCDCHLDGHRYTIGDFDRNADAHADHRDQYAHRDRDIVAYARADRYAHVDRDTNHSAD